MKKASLILFLLMGCLISKAQFPFLQARAVAVDSTADRFIVTAITKYVEKIKDSTYVKWRFRRVFYPRYAGTNDGTITSALIWMDSN